MYKIRGDDGFIKSEENYFYFKDILNYSKIYIQYMYIVGKYENYVYNL